MEIVFLFSANVLVFFVICPILALSVVKLFYFNLREPNIISLMVSFSASSLLSFFYENMYFF